MNKPSLFQQRGVVLVFTMIMLLLLTLVAVNMIQANKQELAMSNNAIRQNAMFASAEKILVRAELALENSDVHRDSSDFQCTPMANSADEPPVQTQLLAGTRPEGFPDQATITQVSCQIKDNNAFEFIDGAYVDTNKLKEVLCSSYDPVTQQISCYSNDTGVNKKDCGDTSSSMTIPDVYADTNHACYNTLNASAAGAHCPIEIYTIRVTASDQEGAQSSVESRYSIGCRSL